MCIIIVKPAGKELNVTLEDHIYNGVVNNPDGFGYMYNDGEQVYIRKGFMTEKAVMKELKKIKKWAKKYDFIFHARWATHGTIDKGNTHPFPYTKTEEHLTAPIINTDMGIAHNGTIARVGSTKSTKLSDTQLFIKDYLTDIPPESIMTDGVSKLILMATSSKFAIMTPTKIKLIGDFISEKNGCYYSNKGYKEVIKRQTTYTNQGWFYGNSYNYYNATNNYATEYSWGDQGVTEEINYFCEYCGEPALSGARWMQGKMFCSKCSMFIKECYECGDIEDISNMSHIPNVCQECFDVYIKEGGLSEEELKWFHEGEDEKQGNSKKSEPVKATKTNKKKGVK